MARYGLRRPFCLFVGNLEPRKNLPRLIEAFALLKARRGRGAPWPTSSWPWSARGPGSTRGLPHRGGPRLSRDVVFTDYVPDADLPALYAAATCFVFPSVYEGFGLPVLEAMAAGTPVVASRAGAIPEVAGDAALLVDATGPADLADAMAAVLGDPALHARLAAAGQARAARFGWETVARQTLGVYEAAHRSAAPGPVPHPP